MTSHQKKLLKEARRCVQRGWSIVLIQGIADDPVAANSSERPGGGKRPITKNGVNDATTDLAKIKNWIKKHPNANIAIATGKKSGLLVLDVDPRNGGDKTLRQLKKTLGPLPTTITSLTGGGGHHIFLHYPSFSVKKDNFGRLLGPGIDVQSDGCYVVVPPSRHASGGSYTWLEGSGPDDIELAELPEAWMKDLDKQVRRNTKTKLNDPPVNAVPEGRRNNHLVQFGGGLRRLGNSPSVILAAMLAENLEKCFPPLDEEEVKSIADSLARYPVGLISNTSSDIAYGIMDAFLDRHFEGGRTLLYSTDGGFWRYDVRMWILAQEEWLKGRILAFLEEMPHDSGRRHASTMAEVLNLIRAKLATADDVLRFRSDPPLVINCKNGELWINEDGDFERRPHSPSSYLRHCLDIDYVPEAQCPTYDATLKEIFANSTNLTAMVRHWHELVGRTIFPDRENALITVFHGRGANGKTALFHIIVQLLGPSLVHAGQLEELDKNRFLAGNLLDKLVFVDDDVRSGARLPDGALKRLSERKLVTAEQKYRNPINFYCMAAPFLLCNSLPSIVDSSDGLFRRLMVIPFGRTFSPAEAKYSPFPEILRNEMSGVLNRALEGYRQYHKRGNFKLPRDVRKATDDWVTTANPLRSFIAEECVMDPSSKWLLKDFYASFTQWAQEAGITWVLQRNTLKRNLEHLGFSVPHSRDGNVVIGLGPRRGISSM